MDSSARHWAIAARRAAKNYRVGIAPEYVTLGYHSSGVRASLARCLVRLLLRIAPQAVSEEWREPRAVADQLDFPSVLERIQAYSQLAVQRKSRLPNQQPRD